ncbi:aspartate dehydrogenase domain-containing protein isoform 3-T3 [Anomaloglossus baeobatrachus]|uniref:aspartate dehydrogenase domain-containing protein isoform X3 n=1 Tax=Anomaloglossus baeobatrachus TaxID=238106 RepID=UPI003F503A31
MADRYSGLRTSWIDLSDPIIPIGDVHLTLNAYLYSVDIGNYLVKQIQQEGEKCNMEIAFVWNRTMQKMKESVEPHLQLHNLDQFEERAADLIVEVAHPNITKRYGERFLSAANLLGLKITMTKHPKSFKLEGKLSEKDLSTMQDRTVLYEGPIRQLCPMAPNNVNTMAAASLAAHTLGFDKVIGVLVADPSLPDWHLVDIEVTGRKNETTGEVFTVKTSRRNPASAGAVTGAATFESFWSSILVCKGHGGRLFVC